MKHATLNQESPLREFLQYTTPAVLSMFLTSFIIVIDGLFIGRVIGSTGLAAVNLTVPFLYLLLGISIMVYVGGMVPATHSLGRKDPAEASRFFSLTFAIGVGAILLVVFCGRIFFSELLSFLNLDGSLQPYGESYLGTLLYFYLFMTVNIGFSIFLRAEGKPGLALFFSLTGNGLNLLLDYLFIVRFGWGLRGAALATGLAVLLPFLCGLTYFLSGRSIFSFAAPRFKLRELYMLLFNGSSEMIGQLSVSITTYIFNMVILRRLGIDGVAAYTVAGYLCMLQGMVLSGIAQGISPLIGRAYGAGDNTMIRQYLRIGLKTAFMVGAFTCIAGLAASSGLPRLYTSDNPEFLAIARRGIAIVSISFLLNGFNIVTSAYFTSLGQAGRSAVISLLRGLVLINAAVLLLPRIMGDIGIWLSLPLTEAMVASISAWFLTYWHKACGKCSMSRNSTI